MTRKAMGDKIEIDITSDTVCPWCYIGKRRLERALEQLQVTSCSLWRVRLFAEADFPSLAKRLS